MFEVNNNLVAYCLHNKRGCRLTGSFVPFSYCPAVHRAPVSSQSLFSLICSQAHSLNLQHNFLHNFNSLQQKIGIVCSPWPIHLQSWCPCPGHAENLCPSCTWWGWSLPGYLKKDWRDLGIITMPISTDMIRPDVKLSRFL